MDQVKILWVDDEIDYLKPHIKFLEDKGYIVYTATNSSDAIDMLKKENFDILFLDENMPGMGGLAMLEHARNLNISIPVVMITKHQEEHLMEEALANRITDFLIKPVNPSQILLTLKKVLNEKDILKKKIIDDFQKDYRQIINELSPSMSIEEWKNIYKKIVNYEVKFQSLDETIFNDTIITLKEEANDIFAKYFIQNYPNWLNNSENLDITLSHNLLKQYLFPHLNEQSHVLFILIDNLRYDQWVMFKPVFEEYFQIINEDLYCSILPTTTEYARNSLFSGLLPNGIAQLYPNLLEGDEDISSKNQFEEELFLNYLKRYGKNLKANFFKVLHPPMAQRYIKSINELKDNNINVLVYNFIDTFAHAKTEVELVKELAKDEISYRAVTYNWFIHSILMDVIRWAAENYFSIFLTTDHGSVQIKNPIKIIGDRETNTNLRFKTGKNLSVDDKKVYRMRKPEQIGLPIQNVSDSYVFALRYDFFVYPNNYQYYSKYFADSFQHGGISLEENLVPYVYMRPR